VNLCTRTTRAARPVDIVAGVSQPYNKPVLMDSDRTKVTVRVIIPARNEEACLGRCLESLVTQAGIGFEIVVVDDNSTDQTRDVASGFPWVQILTATEPAPGISGKCNALIMGAEAACTEWLLFTDADTFHLPGSLAAAVADAEKEHADLLSYSPEQETGAWYEDLLMPLVFAELARTFDTSGHDSRGRPAANGQYILARREVYESLGGHRAVANKVLEDVELAKLFRNAGHRIYFRYGKGRVRTRMYRSFAAMWAGWTKNLGLLFPNAASLGAFRMVEFSVVCLSLAFGLRLYVLGRHSESEIALAVGLAVLLQFWLRVRQAHFPWKANLLSFFGLPLFAILLWRSIYCLNVRGTVTWKGRSYPNSAP
jgi:glycosyltransferase involved in cell wall biosynthesis